MAVQAGLCRARSKTHIVDFLKQRLPFKLYEFHIATKAKRSCTSDIKLATDSDYIVYCIEKISVKILT